MIRILGPEPFVGIHIHQYVCDPTGGAGALHDTFRILTKMTTRTREQLNPRLVGHWRYLPARRRWIRVRFSSLRCFFFAIRLRRFLMTEPTFSLSGQLVMTARVRDRTPYANALSAIRPNKPRNTPDGVERASAFAR